MNRTIVFMLFLVLANSLEAGSFTPEKTDRLKIFYTMKDTTGMFAVVKGKVDSFSSKDEYDKKDLIASAQDKSKVTVRLYDSEGIKEGDTLFVIDSKNLITARIKIKNIFTSLSFGTMIVGYGNFRLSSVGDRVVQKSGDIESKYSYIHKARGDYFIDTGNEGEAIREYKNALKLDQNNPNAHLALGLIYKKQGLDQFAFREFQESYKNINRIYDNDDKFQLLKNMAELRYRQVYQSPLPEKLRSRYRDEGIKYSSEALQIFSESERMNYLLGLFYSKWEDPDDKTARDYFIKVLEIDPAHPEANLALSKLYYKHNNMMKARLYAQKAIDADAASRAAQQWMKKIDEKRQVK